MKNINNCDKNKLYKILQKISLLIDETPHPQNSLLRYLMNNDKKSIWETTYLFILVDAGVIKIYDKEIDIDGKNIFYLQIVDYKKFYRFKGENDISSYFGFDEYTFRLKRVDNSYAVINFYPQKNYGYNTFHLMSCLVKELKLNYKRNGNLIEALIDRSRIVEYIQKQLPNKIITTEWIKSTRGNLIKKIPMQYATLIKVGNYDRKLKGYSFSILLPY